VLFTMSSSVVSPGPGLIIWTLVVGLLLVAGVITGAKGRWGWVLVGLLTGGLPWFVTAFLPARPGSWWARSIRQPAAN
jgi:hypothetical protein